MKSLNIGLPAFLKLACLNIVSKKSALRTYLSGGGYNFYWSMQKCISGIAIGTMTINKAHELIMNLKNETESKHNWNGVNRFNSWLDTVNYRFVESQQTSFASESEKFKIKLTPEISYINDNTITCLQIWNNLNPDLIHRAGKMGSYILSREFRETEYSQFRFGIFNLRTGQIIFNHDKLEGSEIMLMNETRLIESLWIDINQDRDSKCTDTKISTEDTQQPPFQH